MTLTVNILFNGVHTESVLDTAAMVTLVREDYFNEINFTGESGPTCNLTGINNDPIKGKIIKNVPITIGGCTFLHSVCVAPIKDRCLLGIDFLKVTGSINDLSNDTLDVNGEKVSIKVVRSPEMQASNIIVVKRTVVQPQTISYVQVRLEKPIEGPFIVSPTNHRKALLSNVYGEGNLITLKVINDSDTYVTFKRNKAIEQAESINNLDCIINKSTLEQETHCEVEGQDLPPHLQAMYESNISELSVEQKSEFKNLLTQFPDIFSKDDFDLGCLSSGIEHKIMTHDEVPIKEKFRRTPLHFQQQEKEYIKKLLKQGVIEPSISEWSVAPVLVRKKTGELRYCIDYRSLNAKTYKDSCNLPLIDDCLDSLHGKNLFSCLDLSSGYFQIPLEKSSKEKTAFNTRFGTYQWTRLPMGCCTASGTFTRAMQLVLRGMTWKRP